MIFNTHYPLEGKHAFLSASKYHWINYDEDKLEMSYLRHLATQRGTRLHELAHNLIIEKVKLPKTKKTLNLYVNDAIGYKMETEKTLKYSDNCFGTADAIAFNQNLLRIHDLKTGITATSMHQLEVYTALFCLEYHMNPTNIDIELRIYQNDEVIIHNPIPEDIFYIMDKIITFDKLVDKLKMEE